MKKLKGWSLIELMVTMAIVVIVGSVVLTFVKNMVL